MTLSPKYLLDELRRSFHNELMFMRMYPLLQLIQALALAALDLPDHDRISTVNFVYNVVNHDTCFVVLELAGLKVAVGSFNGLRPIISACIMRQLILLAAFALGYS